MAQRAVTPPAQGSLWEVPAPAPAPAPAAKAGTEGNLSPLQAALRLPPRPCPVLPPSERNLHAIREGIAVSASECVVRVALSFGSSLYFVALAGPPFNGSGPIPVGVTRSTDPGATATIHRACPETAGVAAWRGCVLVNPEGRSSTDAARIDAWIAQEEERQQVAMQAVRKRSAGPRARPRAGDLTSPCAIRKA